MSIVNINHELHCLPFTFFECFMCWDWFGIFFYFRLEIFASYLVFADKPAYCNLLDLFFWSFFTCLVIPQVHSQTIYYSFILTDFLDLAVIDDWVLALGLLVFFTFYCGLLKLMFNSDANKRKNMLPICIINNKIVKIIRVLWK
jgi:hypothetical protein